MTTIRILTLLAVVGLVCSPAMATVRTFQPDDGVWGNRYNWLPDDDYPKEGDTAIIPGGKTCRIQGTHHALIIEVYGTLTIKAGYYLWLGDQSPYNPVHTESIIDGELRFEGQSAQGPPFLQIERGGVTIETTDGGGLIIGATPVAADPGEIRTC